jgi:hypothetical protein
MSPQDVLSFHEILKTLFAKPPTEDMAAYQFIALIRYHGQIPTDYKRNAYFSNEAVYPVWIWTARVFQLMGVNHRNTPTVQGKVQAMKDSYTLWIREMIRVLHTLEPIT